ncbi:HSP20-like chaperone [Xylariomycetidae sp. FL2044]|nr:HSP20-like chaperone [Xylariomycetidae sp. FL2044]
MHSSATRTLPTKALPRPSINIINLKPTSTYIPAPSTSAATITTRKMSHLFGPRFYSHPEPNFTGLFRLIDDFDKYQGGGQSQNGRHQVQSFHPKFDMRETENNFELHGELPGIEKANVHIEFTDPQTLQVRGRIERTFTSGTPPERLLEHGHPNGGAITDGDEQHTSKPHKATVEDAEDESSKSKSNGESKDEAPAAAENQQVEKQQNQQQQQQQQEPKTKYWISERSVGEFSRSFSFPSRIDADGVKATLDNGVLTVVVPKAKKHENKRISIH